MGRAPLQVLVLPFRVRPDNSIEYAIFKRADHGDDFWQGIAGGAEHTESAKEAARREMTEEAGIPRDAPLFSLDSVAGVPATNFADAKIWGPNVYVVPEHAFGVSVPDGLTITLPQEHSECRWLPYEEAAKLRSDVEAESNALMNPGDDLAVRSRQGASQVMFRFRKPR